MALKGILKKARQMPPRITIHGGPAVGKTTLGSSFPKPIIITTEDGMGTIKCDHFPVATNYDDFMENLIQVRDGEHDYKTLVIDSLDWLEKLIHAKYCEVENVKSIEQKGYGKGYVECLAYWRNILAILDECRNKGMIIFLIAHSEIRKQEDPRVEPFDKYIIKLHRKASDLVSEYSDVIFFATFNLGSVKVQGKGGQLSSKLVKGDRVLYTNDNPAYLAKNRYALPDELPFDWETIRKAIKGETDGS
tara:strand:+ start:24060 stop:24803 length:744 start_codon:yes stop_codon:yes gene_type:complete